MGVIRGQSETKSAGLNSASVRLMEQLGSTFSFSNYFAPDRSIYSAMYERMMTKANEMKEHMEESDFRAWQVYLSGGSQTLLNGSAHVYRVYCQAN